MHLFVDLKKTFQYFSLDNIYEFLNCSMCSFNHFKWYALTQNQLFHMIAQLFHMIAQEWHDMVNTPK